MPDSDIEQRLRAFFETNPPEAMAVYLFGSTARGTATAVSDVDLAVLYARDPDHTLDALPLELEATIERLVHRSVQIVVLNSVAPDLIHRVLRDGKLLVDRDTAARIRFEVRTRNEFFDLEPIRREYRKHGASAGRR